MSSRGQFVGQGPSSGAYLAPDIPSSAEDLPVNLSDAFHSLASHLNPLKEGEVFPIMSELPKRVKDGMVIYFIHSIPEDPHIDSAGVYLYKRKHDMHGNWLEDESRWWKMLDDPSEAQAIRMIYKKLPRDSTKPDTPPPSNEGDVPPGWFLTPPDRSYDEDIWACVNASYDPDTLVTVWGDVFLFAAAAVDGKSGAGLYHYQWDGWDGTWPANDQVAIDIVETIKFGEAIIDGDTLVITDKNNPAFASQARLYNSTLTPSVWEEFTEYIDGNLLVDGTIVADKLVANTITAREIKADSITGDLIQANTEIRAPIITSGDVNCDNLHATNKIVIGTDGAAASSLKIVKDQLVIRDEHGTVRVKIGNLSY